METGGRKRPPAEKTLENPARVPKVQGRNAESLRQKDGDIQKVDHFLLPFFQSFRVSTGALFGGKKNARGNFKHRSKGKCLPVRLHPDRPAGWCGPVLHH